MRDERRVWSGGMMERWTVRDVLLASDSCVLLLESLHECRNSFEGGGAEGRGCFDCTMRRHVVFGPLEVAAWF